MIVPYCAGHVEGVCMIDRLCFIDPWLTRSLIQELDAPCALNHVAVCPDDTSRVLGFCLGRVIADEYTIHRLAVHPDVQRRGIADRLLRSCMKHAARIGAMNCFIEVRAGNAAALGLYETCGFNTAGMRGAYYRVGNEDAVLMLCALVPGTSHCTC